MIPTQLRDYLIALVRTGVGLAVGAVLTWLAAHFHIVISPATRDQAIVVAMAVLGVAYYAAVHALERRWKWIGLLLGVPAAPSYAQLRADGSYLITDLVGDFTGPDPLAVEAADPNTPGSSTPTDPAGPPTDAPAGQHAAPDAAGPAPAAAG